jgi:hypothetical protein
MTVIDLPAHGLPSGELAAAIRIARHSARTPGLGPWVSKAFTAMGDALELEERRRMTGLGNRIDRAVVPDSDDDPLDVRTGRELVTTMAYRYREANAGTALGALWGAVTASLTTEAARTRQQVDDLDAAFAAPIASVEGPT